MLIGGVQTSRKKIFDMVASRDGYKCSQCSIGRYTSSETVSIGPGERRLILHHLVYHRDGKYTLSDFSILCRKCNVQPENRHGAPKGTPWGIKIIVVGGKVYEL